jgi:hypothetical protein
MATMAVIGVFSLLCCLDDKMATTMTATTATLEGLKELLSPDMAEGWKQHDLLGQ